MSDRDPTPNAPDDSRYVPELPNATELQALLEGRYVIESFLGRGGMGVVYKGLQLPLKRPVAIKILAKQPEGADDEYAFEERFKREAYAMAALTHPNIVQVYDCGDASEHLLFISMELVEGGDLAAMIKVGGVTPETALAMIRPICDGLQAAHERGIVHRDIKPANIFLTLDGRPKVADFGLAKNFDASATMLTKTGLGMGTPDYAAPEQYDAVRDIDHRADIYSLGVMFYQMLTGTLPRGAYTPPSNLVGVDQRLDAVISKAMAQNREARYQSAAELKAEVQHIVDTWMQSEAPTAILPPRPTKPGAGAGAGATKMPSAAAGVPKRTSPVQARSQPVAANDHAQPPKSRAGLMIGVLGALAAAMATAAFFLSRDREPKAAKEQIVAVSPAPSQSNTTPSRPAPPQAAATAKAPRPAPSPTGQRAAPAPEPEAAGLLPGMIVRPARALTFAGHQYQLIVTNGRQFRQAEADARAIGGHLATINSKEEASWITRMIIPLMTSGAGASDPIYRAFIGGIRDGTEKRWRWTTREPFLTDLWMGNPAEAAAGEPACLIWSLLNNEPWAAERLDAGIRGYIVEWDEPIPSPNGARAPEARP